MRTIVAGVLALALAPGLAFAQSAAERVQILRDFDESVVEYTQRHRGLLVFPEAINAATHDPKIITLPVAMLFRQLIAGALAADDGRAAINGVGAFEHATVMKPVRVESLHEFPRVIRDALPPLPPPLEYRLVGHDLVIRDAEADLVIGVVRDAVGARLTVIR